MTNYARIVALAVCALVGSVALAGAAAVSVANLGFDPSRFGLPIYPGSTLHIGGAASGKDFSGRTRQSAVLETSASVDAVANWYAMNWPGAERKTYPGAPVAIFNKPWGTTAISVTIARSGVETDIQIIVPGSY